MKRLASIFLLVVMIFSISLTTSAHDVVGCLNETTTTNENAISPMALWSCPISSSHTGWYYVSNGDEGHAMACRVCDVIIHGNFSHTWNVSSPNCEEGKRCESCGYVVPGQEYGLGHLPSSTFTCFNSTIHVRTCGRSNCPTQEYNGGVGYLYSEEHIFSYYYYIVYRNPSANNVFYHDRWDVCYVCAYEEYTDYFYCAKQDETCDGNCR